MKYYFINSVKGKMVSLILSVLLRVIWEGICVSQEA